MSEDQTGRTFLLLAVANALLLAAVFIIGVRQQRGASRWSSCADLGATGGSPEGCSADMSGDVGPVVRIDDMTVQLRSRGEDCYLQFSVGLEVDARASQELVGRQAPRIRDEILRTLADRSPEQLRGSEALLALKQSLLQRLRQVVSGKRIRAVYFTQFAIL